MMRELVSVLAGNELIYGIVLGAWLLLTGLGSWLGMTAGRLRRGLDVFLVAQVLVAMLPAVSSVLAAARCATWCLCAARPWESRRL